ncbi:suppressor of fused domain protein [Jatrophihabitans fulvus]
MPSAAMKAIFQRAWDTLGGEPKVIGHQRDDGPGEIDVLYCADVPTTGVTSYATIGMYAGDSGFTTEDDVPLRVELLGLCGSSVTEFPNMLASCAFNVLSGEYSVEPGLIYPDVVGQYRPDATMRHMLLVPVFAWDPPANLAVDGLVVTWLQAVPVSQSEAAHARAHGVESLETLLEQADADVADIDREPVV